MPAFAIIAALAFSAPITVFCESSAEKGPLLTADLFYGTRDILSDAYMHAVGPAGKKFQQQFKVWRESHGIKSHSLSELDVFGFVETKTQGKVKKEEVTKAWETVKAHKNVIQEKVTAVVRPIVSRLHKQLEEKAIRGLEAFEEFLPAYKGKVPKTLPDVAVFVFSTLAVLYVLARMVVLALRTALGVMCLFLCCPCRLCRRGQKVKAKGGKNKGKAETKPAAKPAAGKNDPKRDSKKKQ